MKKTVAINCFVLVLLVLGKFQMSLMACSMVKITQNGHTVVGNNEDAWSLESKIWFEQGGPDTYGVAYVGHKEAYPQGGMNEAGLAYDGFTVSLQIGKNKKGQKPITDSPAFLKQLMQTCATIDEVQTYLSQYNLNRFATGMFMFVDRSGEYLILESDSLTRGSDATYTLVNLRPSLGTLDSDIKISRYHKGKNLMASQAVVTPGFCAEVMDTMQQCRGDLGDGTLYTSVYDLDAGEVYLYFYHDYSHEVVFNLEEELAKGDHVIAMPPLFPENPEYEALRTYKTPINSHVLLGIILLLIGISLFSSAYFVIEFFRLLFSRKEGQGLQRFHLSRLLVLVNTGISIVLIPIFLLREPIFYFGMAGSLGGFPLTEVIYFPLLQALLTLIMATVNFRIIQQKRGGAFSRGLLTTHTACLCVFVALYAYWGLLIPA